MCILLTINDGLSNRLKEGNSKCPVCDDTLEEKVGYTAIVTIELMEQMKSAVTLQVWRDVFAERELDKLLIHCSNEKFQCVWIGQKRSLLVQFNFMPGAI